MLHAEAVLRHGRRTIVLRQVGDARRSDRESLRRDVVPRYPTGARRTQVSAGNAQVIGERWVGGCIVDVVALHALEEGSEAAAETGLAVSEHVFRAAYT